MWARWTPSWRSHRSSSTRTRERRHIASSVAPPRTCLFFRGTCARARACASLWVWDDGASRCSDWVQGWTTHLSPCLLAWVSGLLSIVRVRMIVERYRGSRVYQCGLSDTLSTCTCRVSSVREAMTRVHDGPLACATAHSLCAVPRLHPLAFGIWDRVVAHGSRLRGPGSVATCVGPRKLRARTRCH